MGEGLKKEEMEDREESPEGGCNFAGGSNISLQHCHRHKHTSRHPWMTVVFEGWSVWGEYSVATGINTYCHREVSDNSKLYTIYYGGCGSVDVCVHVCVCMWLCMFIL